jgi:imidazole glycerol phosphate synthase glutamine amidotransferase subunit
MIAIIDYDAGNIKSVEKAILSLGEEVVVTRDAETILQADGVILPGVGAFGDAMEKLHAYKLVDVIHQCVAKKIPFLGICLGLQLMFESSEETPGVEGLHLLDGKILRIPEEEGLKIPHIGWNNLKFPNRGRLFKDLPEELKSVPDSDLVCIDYHATYKGQRFNDPVSERGCAVCAKDYKKMPVSCGVYDKRSKNGFTFKIRAEDVRSGVYSWVKLGRCYIGRDSLFWFPWSWRSFFSLKDYHLLADGMDVDPNWYELWVSAREGDGGFLIDRLALRRVKPSDNRQ